MLGKQSFLVFIFCFFIVFAFAQAEEENKTVKKDTAAVAPAKAPKQKEIKKLEDPLLALPQDLIDRMKKMKPNQLLMIDEKFMRNEKRVDESGEEYEVTVTVRMGFSQDMITGIVKEVPLYNSNGRETNIIYVKIPVKFCCTTPIDTLHTKQHCGKMSELNDFEDNDHCKDWAQKEEAQATAGGGFGKPGGSKPGSSTKKGGGVSGQTSITGDDDFGKPMPKAKAGKKGKNAKGKTGDDDDDVSDSTQAGKDSLKIKPITKPTTVTKDKKATTKEKEETFGKPTPAKKGFGKKQKAISKDDEEDGETATTDSTKQNTDSVKAEKKETPDFGKPQPKEKSKKKEYKKPTKDKKEDDDKKEDEAPVADSSKTESKPTVPAKAEKKKEVKKEDNQDDDFGKPQPKEKGKKKKDDKKEKEELPVNDETKPVSDSSGVIKDSTSLTPTKPAEKDKKKKKG